MHRVEREGAVDDAMRLDEVMALLRGMDADQLALVAQIIRALVSDAGRGAWAASSQSLGTATGDTNTRWVCG